MKTIEWASGLFEGEGCVSKIKETGRYNLAIEMSDLDVIEEWHKFWELTTKITHRKARREGYKPTYQSQSRDTSTVYKMLEAMLPHLGERRAYKALNCLDDIDKINTTN